MKKKALFILLVIVVAFSSAYIYLKGKKVQISSIFSNDNQTEMQNATEFHHGLSEVLATGVCNSGIILCSKDGVYLYNKKGEVIWKYSGVFNSPIIKTAGTLIIIADRGAKNVIALEGGKVKWEYASQGEVINAGVNRDGYTWVAHEQAGHRGAVTLLSPQGVWLFTRKFAEDFVVSADLSQDSSELLINSIDTSKIKVNTKLTFINIKGDVFASINREDEVFPCVGYMNNSNIVAIGDKSIIFYDDKKNEKWQENLEDTKTYAVFFENADNVILATSGKSKAGFFEGANSVIRLMDKNAKTVWQNSVRGQVKTIDCKGSVIALNTGRELFIFNLKGKEKGRYSPGKDIKEIKIIDNLNIAVFTRESVILVSI